MVCHPRVASSLALFKMTHDYYSNMYSDLFGLVFILYITTSSVYIAYENNFTEYALLIGSIMGIIAMGLFVIFRSAMHEMWIEIQNIKGVYTNRGLGYQREDALERMV